MKIKPEVAKVLRWIMTEDSKEIAKLDAADTFKALNANVRISFEDSEIVLCLVNDDHTKGCKLVLTKRLFHSIRAEFDAAQRNKVLIDGMMRS